MATDTDNHQKTKNTPVLRGLVESEILAVRDERKSALEGYTHPIAQRGIIFLCLIVNLVFLTSRSDYIALFIAASIYLNMFYFVSLLIPTSRTGFSNITPDILRPFSWLKEMGFIPGTSRFTRVFMNAFFLNSRALTYGISLIFLVDIFYAFIAYFLLGLSDFTILIVVSQAAIIIAFYLMVWRIEPFSVRYAKNIQQVKSRLSREKIPPGLVTALFFFGFILAFLLFVTTIILLPGMTVTTFLTQSGLSELGYLVALLAVLAFSQYFIVRYLHGISSRKLAERIFEYKESALDVLIRTLDEEDAGSLNVPVNPVEFTTVLLESKIYQIRKNTLAGLFPVFVVSIDMSVLLDSSTLTRITGYIHDGH